MLLDSIHLSKVGGGFGGALQLKDVQIKKTIKNLCSLWCIETSNNSISFELFTGLDMKSTKLFLIDLGRDREKIESVCLLLRGELQSRDRVLCVE